VKVPELKVALPAKAGPPISKSVQLGGRPVLGLTTRVTDVECERLPLAPVMVSVYVPAGVVLTVATLNAEEPDPPLMDVGLKLPVAPVGKPLTLSDTVPLNPFSDPTFAV
jgi:hypothetical protein